MSSFLKKSIPAVLALSIVACSDDGDFNNDSTNEPPVNEPPVVEPPVTPPGGSASASDIVYIVNTLVKRVLVSNQDDIFEMHAEELTTAFAETNSGECGGSVSEMAVVTNIEEERVISATAEMADYCTDDFNGAEITINGDYQEVVVTDEGGYLKTKIYNVEFTTSYSEVPSKGEDKYSELCVLEAPGQEEDCLGRYAVLDHDAYLDSISNAEDTTFENVLFIFPELSEFEGSNMLGYSFASFYFPEGVDTNELPDTSTVEGYAVSVEKITQCENGNLGSGSITLIKGEDEADPILVTFNNCEDFDLNYQGNSETLPQVQAD